MASKNLIRKIVVTVTKADGSTGSFVATASGIDTQPHIHFYAKEVVEALTKADLINLKG